MSQGTNQEVAIKLSGIKKMYRLGQIGGGTLQGDLQSWWARVRGKEDPNLKLGQDYRLSGQTFMALNGIDLTIYKGEAVGIIGGNGAGKSTLLKLLSRVTAPTAGEIDIYGRIASMLEVGTGFNGEMTGRENIYMNGAILGMTKSEIDSKMEQIIEFSEVREFIDTPVKRYSSGMYVKLAFSVAAHLDSEIMIMDEVLAVGDMKFQQKCLGRMGDAANTEGRTVLYVSHNMSTIRQLCNRCIVLDKGKIVFDGNTEDAIQIYMGQSISGLNNEVDLTQIQHQGEEFQKEAIMEYFKFVGRERPIYAPNEVISCELKINMDTKADDLCLRIMVYCQEGYAIGMATTSRGAISSELGAKTLKLNLNMQNVAPGDYFLKFALYRVNEFGANKNIDVVDHAAKFTIENVDTYNNLAWNNKWWGYIQLPPIQVLGEYMS